MKAGDLVRLTFTEKQRGDLVGALAIIQEIYSVSGVLCASVLVTTGPSYGRRRDFAVQDMTKLS
jgi:hypothetical protein|tara:strand:+ start:12601 stop:12792 length:192 start_codon:yes stop_codon:yes gene_type:complete